MGGGGRHRAVRAQQGGSAASDRADGAVRRQGGVPAGDVRGAGQYGGDPHPQADGGDAAGEVRAHEDDSVYGCGPVLV